MGDKSILVTGGAGYIGSHTCKALKARGYTPVVYDNLYSSSGHAVRWGPMEKGDVRDKARLISVIESYKPSAIIHFAAHIRVGESVSDPALYYSNNVYGSHCVFDAAKEKGIKNIVFSSSAAVYGIAALSPVSENSPKEPINPYGRTKMMMEQMAADYSAAYDMNFAALRYFNAAGADPDCELGTAYKIDTHIIPLLMRVASGLMPAIHVFGTDYDTADGTAIRDYIHVTDLAEAHILALEHIQENKKNLICNVGGDKGTSVAEIIAKARTITGHAIPQINSGRRAGDPSELVADISRIKSSLGWEPIYSDIDNIIRTAWAWRQKQNETASA